jgi:2-polyprenyl-3-methyl-5-hydroxy-6-metoxy-1,4-benzoquinol methylase
MSQGRFDDLDFEGFRRAAEDSSLSEYEKIGFPDSYRAGKETAILADIERKLTNLQRGEQRVLDIGTGCSPLPRLLIDRAATRRHVLFMADSAEMLARLADAPGVVKLPGRFPQNHREFVAAESGRLDAVLIYSVLHYVYVESNLHDFLDSAVALLAHGGQLLVGDIPNLSMRRRFFASPAGAEYHRSFSGESQPPVVEHGVLHPGKIDDAVLLGLLMRYREAGFNAYLAPQSPDLPMHNRREDLLVVRP